MKVLIIGAGGFIGNNALHYFKKKGFDVTGYDVFQPDADVLIINPAESGFDSIFQKETFDICINASGSANVSFSFENPARDFELNVANVNKLLTSIRSYNPKCKFINFSSAAVYGNPLKLPITENSETKPLSPYGFHKLQSEYLLTEYHHFFGLHTCNLRIFSAYGPGLKKQLFWDLYQKTKSPDNIELFGSGEESRDFIYIDDLLQALHLIIERGRFEGDIINIASGKEITIREASTTFYHTLNPAIKFAFGGKVKVGDPNNWHADISKLKDLGFAPEFTLQQGLTQYIKWLKESGLL
jgi:dTDP-glucose 4,6-dehydratase/UDP-glucose 4-epimerase